MDRLEKDILALLAEDSRLTAKKIAAMTGSDEKTVSAKIAALEDGGVIVKYTAILNNDSIEEEFVEALIEVKVTPRRGHGFDMIANEIAAHAVSYERVVRPCGYRSRQVAAQRVAVRFGKNFHLRQRDFHCHALHFKEI